ncbi:MAG TPA: hypothetical protein VF131_06755 [Blastocatellia bacterium]|nr:hypothetical protein [Blastocatellia bacterium]
MSLKTRVDKLASRAGLNDCPGCASAVIQIYDSNDPRASQPKLRNCPKCGRARGITDIIVMIPDNHRDVA